MGCLLVSGLDCFGSNVRGPERGQQTALSAGTCSPLLHPHFFAGATSSVCVRPARAPPADLRFFQDRGETRRQTQQRWNTPAAPPPLAAECRRESPALPEPSQWPGTQEALEVLTEETSLQLSSQGGNPILSQASFLVGSGGRGSAHGYRVAAFDLPFPSVCLLLASSLSPSGAGSPKDTPDLGYRYFAGRTNRSGMLPAKCILLCPHHHQDEYPNFSRGCQRHPKLEIVSKQFNLDNFLEWGSQCSLGKTTLAAHTSGEDTSTFPRGGGESPSESISLGSQCSVLQKQIRNSPNRSALREWEVVGRGQSAQVQHRELLSLFPSKKALVRWGEKEKQGLKSLGGKSSRRGSEN